ncbi:type IV pilus modification PilV family protein [Candidatus Sulfurimonas baltica]|uniref:Type II secretion system protein n=1 Tax=Candidatus Sulfurimonas baltica TaxID=2740404 RepID=A0A7S7LWR6_9BACT|nr:prepilin-type N-terminal cleavage/methylation domain-containing protein [Candidatus Sulfurimonas baltica]QOY52847.1 type II secretion system protein [Candidatus Sulfurimonas baltica]
MRKGFTLIEVMVAVLIISVVIAALLQMKGNSSHIFFELEKKIKINQFVSFIIENKDYGFENETTTLDKLISDFDLDDDLRRRVKQSKVEVVYQVLERIDMSDIGESDNMEDRVENQAETNMVFEIGKTVLKSDTSSAGLLRLRVQ